MFLSLWWIAEPVSVHVANSATLVFFSIMRGLSAKLIVAAYMCLAGGTLAGGTLADATKRPEVQILPSLREQAQIVDAWTDERKALIPGILRKYGVDAWLVRRAYHPDSRPTLSHI